MTYRQSIQTTFLRLHNQARKNGQLHLSARAVALGIQAGVYFLLAAALAGAVILENRSPFPAALVGAAGPGICGGAALLGSILGWLIFLPFSEALRYLSAAILIYAVAFAFYDLRPIRQPWFMPVLSGALVGLTGFLVEAQSGFSNLSRVHLTLEVLLTFLAVRCYREVLAEGDLFSPARRGGGLVLLSTVLLALTSLPPLGPVNVGRTLAILGVVCAARQGGASAGAVAGAAFGLAADLSSPGLPLRCALCTLVGLAAGVSRGQSRSKTVLWSWGATGLAVLWLWDKPEALSILCEGLLGPIGLFLIPESFLRKLSACLSQEAAAPTDRRAREQAREKLEAAAAAFRSLGDSLHLAFRARDNDNDIATVFDRAANRACRTCALRNKCWQQDYSTTFNALNDATASMVDRGRALPGDFPRHFADRCVHFPEFVATVNEELTALFYRRQYNVRIRESRSAVYRQYEQLSDLLGSTAAELSVELSPDLYADKLVRRRMAELGLEVRTAVFRDGRGLLRLQAEGPAAGELAKSSRLSDLSRLLDAPLRVELRGEGDSLSLIQEEPLMAVAGVAARKKTGETVSGDAGTYFKRPDGTLYLLLCDGMGTGPEANRESSLAVRLLEQFLLAGVDTGHALTTLASALALRGEETGGFTTVDLLQVSLFDGACSLYKLGAAPTYIKHGSVIDRFTGTSLPAGLAEGTGASIDRFTFRLDPGDCVLMVSDGVCTAGDDGWAQEQLRSFDGTSPKELARSLIAQAPAEPPDDRTALVLRLEARRP